MTLWRTPIKCSSEQPRNPASAWSMSTEPRRLPESRYETCEREQPMPAAIMPIVGGSCPGGVTVARIRVAQSVGVFMPSKHKRRVTDSQTVAEAIVVVGALVLGAMVVLGSRWVN